MNDQAKLRICLFLLIFLAFSCSKQENDNPRLSTAEIPQKRDKAAYERFLMLNERVKNNQGTVDILFLGDSITARWESTGQKIWNEYYKNLNALNFGIEGDRTQHLLWRIQNSNLENIEPKVAVLLIGTNNSGSDRNTTSDMYSGVVNVAETILKKLPDTELLLLGIFPRGRNFNEQRSKITQVNQALSVFATTHERIHFLDIGCHFLNPDGSIPDSIMPDALHLSEEGYQIWAELMNPFIEELLDDS